MKICTISDTHWKFDEIKVPECDILLHAGDVSGKGTKEEIVNFLDWYGNQSAKYKILIAGNHDFGFEYWLDWCTDECNKRAIVYLNDSGCTIEGIRIWGSPVQPEFFDWAFNRARTKQESSDFGTDPNNRYEFIGTHWDKIPSDTDILITHGPAFDRLDQCSHGARVGCDLLLERIEQIKPKMHVFGHIHEARGIFVDKINNITYVNASSLDLRYNPHKDNSFLFDWYKVKKGESRGRDF